MAFLLIPLVFLAAAGAVGAWATPYMGLATFAYSLFLAGIYFRKRDRNYHRAALYSAMAIDLVLVLVLEFQREAVLTVVSLELSPWQLAHVVFSVLALLLYLPMIFLGSSLWANEREETRRWHRRLGWLAFAFRSLGFALMFSLLDKGVLP